MMPQLVLCLACLTIAPNEPFRIDIVDAETGRGVPLVEIETVNHVRFVSDSQGIVAINDPDLMGQEVHFLVRSHGYEYPADGFGIRGVRLRVEPGQSAKIKIHRLNVAERLYRVTGGGIYRDSLMVGASIPIENPLLNARVIGSDSVQNAILDEQLLWFWGDTNWPVYPLGNFHTPGATSERPSQGGLDPAVGVNLRYFVNPETGFASETARMEGEGPTWISGLTVLTDDQGQERLFCGYVKVRPPMTVYRHGLAEWDRQNHRWSHVLTFSEDRGVYPDGHPFQHETSGVSHVYFPTPYPLTRVEARVEALRDLDQYETFTCLSPGSTAESPKVERDADGHPVFAWRKNAPAYTFDLQKRLLDAKLLLPSERLLVMTDVETGDEVIAHGGSVCWNDFRQRWVMIFVQLYGKPSLLGEVWYAEAEAPVGPWAYARRIVTHDKYSFYNPKQHPYFDQKDGRLIYFEGTYVTTFSGNEHPTPRYDYNQIMYRLDLKDPRMVLPVPVYRVGNGWTTQLQPMAEPNRPERAFYAADRPAPGLVPLAIDTESAVPGRLTAQATGGPSLAYALPANTAPDSLPSHMRPLWEWTAPDGEQVVYVVGDSEGPLAWKRAPAPIAYVWSNPGPSRFVVDAAP